MPTHDTPLLTAHFRCSMQCKVLALVAVRLEQQARDLHVVEKANEYEPLSDEVGTYYDHRESGSLNWRTHIATQTSTL